jgi:hypothetical protein
MFAEGSEGLVHELMDRRRAGRFGICEPRPVAILGLEMIHRVHLRTVQTTLSPRSRSCSILWRPKPLFAPVIGQGVITLQSV